jgi:hypothetical protein
MAVSVSVALVWPEVVEIVVVIGGSVEPGRN